MPDTLLRALGERFVETGAPRNLTEIHPIIAGMGPGRGLEHLAHPGLVARAIGSGFSFLKTSAYSELLRQGAFEAHVVPMGTLFQMLRDTAAGRDMTLTRVGLDTFVDPAMEGGRMNTATPDSLARRIEVEGQPWLRYEPPRIDIALLRGTTADEHGNISLEDEPVSLGVRTLAMAAKASGGKVVVQVSRLAKATTLHPRQVEVPSILVDAVVVDPGQSLSGGALNPALTGRIRMPEAQIEPLPAGLSRIIARRAADEVNPHDVVNLGVGIPVQIPTVLHEYGRADSATFFPEHGSLGGIPGGRAIFGTNINPVAIIDSTFVFDYFQGGGLDVTFLGFGQIDAAGNVNVSKFNGIVPGCGGFIDITHVTQRVVFCGTFSASGADILAEGGLLTIRADGSIPKFVPAVEQVTFNGRRAAARGTSVLYITERAVFSLRDEGIEIVEIAPGVDLHKDVLDRIPFAVATSPALRTMNPAFFA